MPCSDDDLTSCATDLGPLPEPPPKKTAPPLSLWLNEKPRRLIVHPTDVALPSHAIFRRRVRYQAGPVSDLDKCFSMGQACLLLLAIGIPIALLGGGLKHEVTEQIELVPEGSGSPKSTDGSLMHRDWKQFITNTLISMSMKTRHLLIAAHHEGPIKIRAALERQRAEGGIALHELRISLISDAKHPKMFQLVVEGAAEIYRADGQSVYWYVSQDLEHRSQKARLSTWMKDDASKISGQLKAAFEKISKQIVEQLLFKPNPRASGSAPIQFYDKIIGLPAQDKLIELQVRQTKAEVLARAKGGDPYAQYLQGMDSADINSKYRWLCLAANNGEAAALYGLAMLYHKEFPPDKRDPIKAYQYFLLGKKELPNSAYYFAPELNNTQTRMSAEEIRAAKKAAADWKPDPAACPN